MKAKVAIVGGGVMGTSIALHLAGRLDPLREPVVLLERAPELGAGSSGRSGAILRQQYADREVARMARDSLRVYADFEGRTGRSVGFRRTGVLTVAGPEAPEWVERLLASVAMLAELGIETRVVDAPEIRRLVPGIEVHDEAVGAWEPGGGFVDPAATLDAFSALARTHGAVTRLGVEVTAIELRDGAVVGLETSEGRVEANRIVVAAGPWSAALLARVGVELPLRAVRPEQHFLELPGTRPAPRSAPLDDGVALEPIVRIEREALVRAEREPAVPHPVVIDLERGFYTRCEPHLSRTRVGGTDYERDRVLEDPDDFAEDVDPAFAEWARARLVQRLPVYGSLPDAGSQAAWYTLTPDSQAVLGPLPGVKGLFVASGFSGHGFKLAPSVGAGMAQMVLGDEVTAFDAAFFAPARFGGKAVEFGSGAFGL